MPLSNLQSRILRLLASHRNPESYIAGASPLTRSGTRISHDIDVFHDREAAMQLAVADDAATLAAAGYQIEWTRRFPALHSATVSAGAEATALEWLVDSAGTGRPRRRLPLRCWSAMGGVRGNPAKASRINAGLLFVNKKKQKNFINLLPLACKTPIVIASCLRSNPSLTRWTVERIQYVQIGNSARTTYVFMKYNSFGATHA